MLLEGFETPSLPSRGGGLRFNTVVPICLFCIFHVVIDQ